MTRSILHVDMDAFYAAVEQRDDPALRGRPVIVGGTPDGRGVVMAASYEARRFGIRSAMPTATALRLCPHVEVVPGHFARYREASRQVFALLDEFSPLVEPLSIDEAFLDLTGTEQLFGPAETAARKIRERIRSETGLTASVGIAPNKFLAKVASDFCKPDGLLFVPADGIRAFLDPLPVERLWGVGTATMRHFTRLGVTTVGDVRALSLDRLTQAFGSAGTHFYQLSRGLDDRPVLPDREAKSISHEVTFARDVADREHLRSVLLRQVEDVAYRLRRLDLYAGSVGVKIRYPSFVTITRGATLPSPTHITDTLWRGVAGLFEAWCADQTSPVRLIGASAAHLTGPDGRQLSLFEDAESRQRQVDAAADAIRERFGPEALRRRTPKKK